MGTYWFLLGSRVHPCRNQEGTSVETSNVNDIERKRNYANFYIEANEPCLFLNFKNIEAKRTLLIEAKQETWSSNVGGGFGTEILKEV